MEFSDNNNAIYLQIARRVCDDILGGTLREEGRIPSVREYASMVEVNANTVMRAYDYLQQEGIIFNRRGIGYFVAAGARQAIGEERMKRFVNEEMSHIFGQLRLMGVTPEQLQSMYQNFLSK